MVPTSTFTLDELLDDYLHVLVRTQPWDKQRVEPLLEGLVAWLEQRADAPAAPAQLNDPALNAYLAALPVDVRADADAAARGFRLWLERQQVTR